MPNRMIGFLRRWLSRTKHSSSTDTAIVIDDLSERLVVVGLTFIFSGDVAEMYQTHGIVIGTEGSILRIRRTDGSLFHLPFDSGTIMEASPGTYRERNTGIVVEDPDYIIQWEINVRSLAEIDRITANGYVP